jgi:BirA family biotin operon repressor/biotin-[acetyl-CoA-carboxylase] ligase
VRGWLFVLCTAVNSHSQQMNPDAVQEHLTTGFVGRRIVYLASTSSTQDDARTQAQSGAVNGTVVLAEEQTGGRGRFGRTWVSPPGENVYLTLILRPSIDELRSLGIVASLAVAEAVEDVTSLSPAIKWPNDVLIGGRKLAGILVDSELAGWEPLWALVGMGINVNMDVARAREIADIATSLRREVGQSVSREHVVAALLNRFEARYAGVDARRAAFDAWRSRLETLGQSVRVSIGDHVEEGIARDVVSDGSLILGRPDGSEITLSAGEVTLRG